MRLARWIFRIAAIYGIVVLAPMYLLEARVAAPAALLPHPEHYYGFIGTALAAQVMFLVIATDPARYRPLMIAGVLEKLAFGAPVWLLWTQGRVAAPVVAFGTVDLVWAVLFGVAWRRTAAPLAGEGPGVTRGGGAAGG